MSNVPTDIQKIQADEAQLAKDTATLATDEAAVPAPSPTPPPPPPPPSSFQIGWWQGAPDPCPVLESIFLDYAYPQAIGTFYPTVNPRAAGKTLMLKVGAVTPAQATAIGTALVAQDQPNAIIVIMWEQNQGFNGWFNAWNQAKFSAAQYKAIFIAAAQAFCSVPGNNFTIVFNPNAGDGNNMPGRTTWDTWPGPIPGVPKLVGAHDLYDVFGGAAGALYQAQLFQQQCTANGCTYAGSAEFGMNGNDDPDFITQTAPIFKKGLWLVFFSATIAQSGRDSQLSNKPKSLAAFKAAYGALA